MRRRCLYKVSLRDDVGIQLRSACLPVPLILYSSLVFNFSILRLAKPRAFFCADDMEIGLPGVVLASCLHLAGGVVLSNPVTRRGASCAMLWLEREQFSPRHLHVSRALPKPDHGLLPDLRPIVGASFVAAVES
ncbi:hypothetical protein C8R47DRAFT_185650 [Mycena vitilis]|nr:hypothetical protein C8R47DRAFT_185650 [Mycena vitilis]